MAYLIRIQYRIMFIVKRKEQLVSSSTTTIINIAMIKVIISMRDKVRSDLFSAITAITVPIIIITMLKLNPI